MKKLPESEQEIMMIIWEYEEPVSRFQVEEKLNVEKNVAPSTILTLLTRLEKKGFIQKVRNGKSNLYVPLVEKENYIGTVGKNSIAVFRLWPYSFLICVRSSIITSDIES